MRLIDADALKDNMFNYAAPETVWDRGDIEHKINEMPTIDAIPVEWLEQFIAGFKPFCGNKIDWRRVYDALALLKAQEPRVMTFEEVKEKIGSGECVFTECEKEGQWMRYGDAKLSVDQGDSCRIAFLISRRGDNPYVRWWMIYYENYNKTWRCWTSRPTDEQREAEPWNAQK